LTTNSPDRRPNPGQEIHPPRTRGVYLKLYPDTKLAEEWYEGEFTIRGGFAKAYVIGLGEMLELGIADRQASPAPAREVFETAKKLSESDATILKKLAVIIHSTKDNPKYSYVRRLLEVLASWPVHADELPPELPAAVLPTKVGVSISEPEDGNTSA
jgi:hypothetical protein